eukprot:7847599-Pyramimonas_sp.AAC.1
MFWVESPRHRPPAAEECFAVRHRRAFDLAPPLHHSKTVSTKRSPIVASHCPSHELVPLTTSLPVPAVRVRKHYPRVRNNQVYQYQLSGFLLGFVRIHALIRTIVSPEKQMKATTKYDTKGVNRQDRHRGVNVAVYLKPLERGELLKRSDLREDEAARVVS